MRAGNALVQHALDTATAASPTLKGIVADLNASDVIVHIVVEPLSSSLMGSLSFVQSTGGYRYLRVSLRTELSRLEMAAILGHELQHATEIAHAPQVHDAESMHTFYDIIGYPVGDHYHDTDAARDAGKQVRHEVASYSSYPDLR